MRSLILAVVVGVVSVGSAAAQVGPDTVTRDAVRLKSAEARHVVDLVSTGLAIGSFALPCLIHAADRGDWRCYANQGVQVGTGIAASEVMKHILPRERPNGRDKKSWWSEHSEITCANALLADDVWGICPAVMIMRIAADEHYATDTLGGLAAAVVIHKTLPHWGKR
jgi:hypothetical protein